MASNARKQGGKQGGRTTAKGTQPPAKKPRSGPAGGAAAGGTARGAAPGQGGAGGAAEPPTVNRQMRRAGLSAAAPAEAQTKRLRLVLIIAGVLVGLLTILGVVAFGLSGAWVGVLGVAAGLGTSLAVSMNRTFLADKGMQAGIGIGAFGAVFAALGVTGVVNIHWPFAAVVGCGVGAFFAVMSAQQMVSPPGPPAAAVAMLRRNGAQVIDAPGAEGCIWATPDGRIRVIVGATLSDPDTADVLRDKSVQTARQRAALVVRRLGAGGVEQGVICVVDTSTATTRDGDFTVCSVPALTKLLSRPAR